MTEREVDARRSAIAIVRSVVDGDLEDPRVNFFPRSYVATRMVERARAVCRKCLCLEECLAWALAQEPSHDEGIFGGTTPRERRRFRAETRKAAGPVEPAASQGRRLPLLPP